LAEARAFLDSGDYARGLEIAERLYREHPNDLDVGVVFQDCERALLEPGGTVSADDIFRRRWYARADDKPTVATLVLAARAETDAIAAENLLSRALALDPRCAWAHYGVAHAKLGQRERYRWRVARESLGKALDADPGHVQARRLEAWMAAQEGTPVATAALELWIENTLDDPRVAHTIRVEMQLDLATRWILEGRSRPAVGLLDHLEGEDHQRARRLTLLAVAHHEEGDPVAALDAAIRARETGAANTLPLVHEALLYESTFEDVDLAMERWQQVADLSGETGDLADLLQQLRARVRIERAQAMALEAGAETP
tara:strand:- start:185 stop:1126 length:942 start_codon:yes stop_codon:yes gene_type:complete